MQSGESNSLQSHHNNLYNSYENVGILLENILESRHRQFHHRGIYDGLGRYRFVRIRMALEYFLCNIFCYVRYHELTVSTSVKLSREVTDSPGFTIFKVLVPSGPVMNTFNFPLWTIYTFSSGSPRKWNSIIYRVVTFTMPSAEISKMVKYKWQLKLEKNGTLLYL